MAMFSDSSWINSSGFVPVKWCFDFKALNLNLKPGMVMIPADFIINSCLWLFWIFVLHTKFNPIVLQFLGQI